MSQHSLYESNWINLVFENRNKEYGAFQLRQETTKTSFNALFTGILLCAALILLPKLLSHPQEITAPNVPDIIDTVVQLDNIYSNQEEPAAAAPAPLQTQQQAPTEVIDQTQLINPTVVTATLATPVTDFTLDRKAPLETPTDGIAISGTGTSTGEGVLNGTGTGSNSATGTSTGNGNELLMAETLDSKPQFPGGIEKFYRYIGNHFTSPVLDENRNVRIFVSFVVEKDGSMSNIKVLNKPGQALEKEAIRVLQSIKVKWTPGILNSKPVRTAYNLPIVVQVD